MRGIDLVYISAIGLAISSICNIGLAAILAALIWQKAHYRDGQRNKGRKHRDTGDDE